MPRRIESLSLAGPAGRLEALLEEPEDGAPRLCAVVCHPHPLFGGTMHNKVVYRLARGLRRRRTSAIDGVAAPADRSRRAFSNP